MRIGGTILALVWAFIFFAFFAWNWWGLFIMPGVILAIMTVIYIHELPFFQDDRDQLDIVLAMMRDRRSKWVNMGGNELIRGKLCVVFDTPNVRVNLGTGADHRIIKCNDWYTMLFREAAAELQDWREVTALAKIVEETRDVALPKGTKASRPNR